MPQLVRPLGPSARLRRPLEVAAVWVTSGSAALVGRRQDDSKWTTPAGHLEPDEDPAAGAARELWEEAGIRANPADLQKLGARRSGKYLVYCFSLDLPDQVEATSDHDPDEEVEEWRWAPLEGSSLPPEIQANLHVPPNRNALLQALGVAKSESLAVAPGTWRGGEELATLRPHPVGRDWQVVWSDSSGELGRTPPLSKVEAGGLVGQWLAKADGDSPVPAMATPPAATKKPHAPKTPKVKSEPEKSLVVQHNISERGLANAHKIGGLPAPSLAVAHRDNPLTGFGEISLVAHSSMVDPKNKVPLFDSDVYSPRYPRAKRKINERAYRQLEQELKPHLEATNPVGYRSLSAHDVERDLAREQPEDFAGKNHGAAAALGLAYLRSKGEKVEQPPVEMREVPTRFSWGKHLRGLEGVEASPYKQYNSDTRKKVAESANRAIEHHAREQAAATGLDPEKTQKLIDRKKVAADLGEMKDGFYVPHDEIDAYTTDDLLHDFHRAGKMEPANKPENVMAEHVLRRVREDPGFKQYLRDKLGPVQGDEYIEVGESGRKVPHTMENVLKVLTRKVRGGEESTFGGLGQVRSAGSQQFRSLDAAKKAGDRLVSKKDFEAAKKDNENDFFDLARNLSAHHSYYNDANNVGSYDNVAGVVQDFLKTKNVDRALAESGYKPGDVPAPVKDQIRQFAQKLTTMPTEYFEAKPQRAVGLHEFRGAAVPHNASPQTLEILRHHGLRTESYQSGDEEDRKRAIQKLAHEQDLMLSEGLAKSEANGRPEVQDRVANLMRHPDPAERAMALKMSGVQRRHLAQALLSEDPALVAAALAHPSLDEETIGALAASSGRWNHKRALLARPDLALRHLEQMVRSALH